MEKFIQLHVLTAYPPSNLNRDMLGRPKTAYVGNTQRLRISSQSLKRAWRQSSVFMEQLAGNVGTRTRNLVEELKNDLIAAGINEKQAAKTAKIVAEIFGKVESSKGDEDDAGGKQLFFFTPKELEFSKAIALRVANGESDAINELEGFAGQSTAADVALFGRMLAEKDAKGRWNVEAACQAAHAFSVQKVTIEEDDFTAVDDLSGDTGAGHMGVSEFGSGLYYLYICIDRELLQNNLKNDQPLTKATLAALVEAVLTVAPTGKQNSFGSRAYASYVLAEKGTKQPRSLSVAYLSALSDSSELLNRSIEKLETTRNQMDSAYWGGSELSYVLNPSTGSGSLKDLIEFIKE